MVTALQVSGVVLLWVSAPFALALTVAAAGLQLALQARLGMLRAYRRDLCRELVIAGRERLPLAALESELRRLRDPRHQGRLARAVEELVDLADHHHREIGLGPPLHSHRVLLAVEPELRDLVRLVRAYGVGVDVRGVALLDRLITSGASPLYGSQVGPLRDELGRIRYLLGSGF